MTSAVLTEIERQRRAEQARTWDASEKVLAEKLYAALQPEFTGGDKRDKVLGALSEPLMMSPDLEAALWNSFVEWANERKVRHLPAKPATVAAFLHQRNVPHDQVLDAIAVIARQHSKFQLANPCATAIVRGVLELLFVDDEPPRSWRPEVKEVWAWLPADIRHEIARIDRSREVAFNRLYRRQADYTKQLEKNVKANLNVENESKIINDRPREPNTLAAG
jgi:hypothetical protein